MLFASQFNTKSTPSDVQTFLETHLDKFVNLPGVCGSFKTVKQISDTLAVACIKQNNATQMFADERKLLDLLREVGLPTIKYYGDIFTLNQEKAVLLDWISHATLLDSKDSDTSSSKLFALTLGINIPTGEGWVFYKDGIEKEIQLKLETGDDAFALFKQVVQKLSSAFNAIKLCLDENQLLINDLQMMVTKEGKVWIIDPQDVVKSRLIDVNRYSYTSLLDLSEQDNPDFIKKLYDSKNLLSNCVNWCEKVALMRTPQELIDFITKGIEPLSSPRAGNLLAHVKQKLSPRGVNEKEISPRGQARSRRKAIQVQTAPQAQSSLLTTESPEFNSVLKQIQTLVDKDLLDIISVDTTPRTTPKSSPTKSPRTKENTENLPRSGIDDGSPSKLLAFQFNSVSFGSSGKAKRKLISSADDETLPAEQAITQTSSKSVDLNV